MKEYYLVTYGHSWSLVVTYGRGAPPSEECACATRGSASRELSICFSGVKNVSTRFEGLCSRMMTRRAQPRSRRCMATRAGRAILAARRRKGRKELSA